MSTKAFARVVPVLLLALLGAACQGGATPAGSSTSAPRSTQIASGGGTQSAGGAVVGSGTLRSETRSVQGFDSVDLAGTGTLEVRQTGAESLVIRTDDNVLPLIRSDVSGGVLHLGPKDNTSITTTDLTYTLTVKALKSLTRSGSATITASEIRASGLSIVLQGAGGVQIAGQADSENVSLNGAGDYDASNLAVRTATVELNGAGQAMVRASDSLTATINGAGQVRYFGNPSVTHNGGGEVIRA
jgi:hypothetical protein